MSPHFFAKRWPRGELEGLFAIERKDKRVIIPIWKGVTEDDVKREALLLAGRLGIDAGLGIPSVVHEIKRSVGLVDSTKALYAPQWENAFRQIDREIGHAKKARELSETVEGVEMVAEAARFLMSEAAATAARIVADHKNLGLRVEKTAGFSFGLNGPNRLCLYFYYGNSIINSLSNAVLELKIMTLGERHTEAAPTILEDYQLKPTFNEQLEPVWNDGRRIYTTPAEVIDFALERFSKRLPRR